MSEKLTARELAEGLAGLPGWSQEGGALVRSAKLATFPLALGVVAAVGAVAQGLNHHPDIDIRYRSLTFTLTSHDLGGLSKRDLALAHAISDILDAQRPAS